MNDENKIRQALDAARDEIVRLDPYRAFDYLRSIKSEVDGQPNTAFWAEYQFLYANAHAVQGNPGVESYFEEALDRVRNLANQDLFLEMRVHEDFAKYLASVERRRSTARMHNQTAKELAIKLERPEDVAKLQLRVVKLDLECDEDARLGDFQQLRKAGKELGCTCQRQLAAWVQYCGEHQEGTRGRLAARSADRASIGYFRHLLSSIQ